MRIRDCGQTGICTSLITKNEILNICDGVDGLRRDGSLGIWLNVNEKRLVLAGVKIIWGGLTV